MGRPIIKVENVSKHYRLGQIGVATLRESLGRVARRLFHAVGVPEPHQQDKARSDVLTDLWALHDVSFDVMPGEVLGIIGRNGAGKSTLLKILSRITEPTAGKVLLRGRAASLLEVGTGFHPELSGRENIFLNGAILGMKKSEIARKFDEIVAFAEVERFIDTPVRRYSSGMYVRLAFAVAAHLEPEILIVDEVLAVGDASFQRRCLGRMKTVAEEGRTVLFVSHNMDAMLNLCQRGIVLEKGCLVYDGKAASAVERYLGGLPQVGTGIVDLREHAGRPEGMPLVLTGVGIRPAGQPDAYGKRLRTGEDLAVDIHYDTGGTMLDLVQLGFCSVVGQRLFTVGTHLSQADDLKLIGKGCLTCTLPQVLLAGGEYSVTVMIGRRNPPSNVDYVERAVHFHVDTGDYYGTGKTQLPTQGFWVQRSSWASVSVIR